MVFISTVAPAPFPAIVATKMATTLATPLIFLTSSGKGRTLTVGVLWKWLYPQSSLQNCTRTGRRKPALEWLPSHMKKTGVRHIYFQNIYIYIFFFACLLQLRISLISLGALFTFVSYT